MTTLRIMVIAQYAEGQRDECFGKCKFEKICSNLGRTGTGPGCSYTPKVYVTNFTVLNIEDDNN